MNAVPWPIAALLWLCTFPALLQAETRYVTDRVLATMHAQPERGSAVIARLPTGTSLGVVGSAGEFLEVVDDAERRGWVDSTLLTTDQPALVTLMRVREEQARTRAELERLRAQEAGVSFVSLVVATVGALLIGFGLGLLWYDHRLRVRYGGFRI